MWKILMVSSIILLCTSSFIYAGPASPDFFDILQPDGTVFKARQLGDEFQGWTETEDGYTVIHNKTTKSWEYAEQNPDGTLKSSGLKVLPGVTGPPSIPKKTRPPRNKALEQHKQKMLLDMNQERINLSSGAESGAESGAAYGISMAPGDWTPVTVSGNKKMLVILVNFADRNLSTSAANWNSKIFDTTTGALSVANYYMDNSFNKLAISPAAHTQAGNPAGIITVNVTNKHPDCGNELDYSIESSIINNALAAASWYINFASYDTNGNGSIEQSELAIYLIYAGYEASGTTKTPNIWAHAWGGWGGVSVVGKKVDAWALNGELSNNSNWFYGDIQQPMGVIAHELGHALCGLPDLYDTSATNEGLGLFSLMAGGSWGANIGQYGGETPTALDIWSREFLGWSTPAVPTISTTLSLPNALSSPYSAYKLIKPASSSTEYFLLENRQPTGWDLGLKRSLGSGWQGGLLLTHIDIEAGTLGSNNINSFTANAGRQGVIPVQASTASCDMMRVREPNENGCRGDATTLFYSGNNSSWGPRTTPNSKYYNETETNFLLLGISAPSPIMTANLSLTLINDDDIYEDDDTLLNASAILVPFYDNSLKCDDDDWFKVWVQEGEKLEVTINFLHANGDLDLSLYNPSNYLLSFSTTASNQEIINYGPSATNEYYYIKVYGYNGAKNSYSLSARTYTTESPDLRDKQTDFKSTEVNEGGNFWYSAYIYNSGLSSAVASHARLYLSTNGDGSSTYGDYNIGDVTVSSLAPLTGQWVTWYFTMPNIGSGIYPVWGKVVVDSWDEVYEGIEDYGAFTTSDGSNDFTAYDVRTLSGLTIIGTELVNESSSAAYLAIASWSDGTTTTVTPTWSEINIYASISISGLLTTTAVTGNKPFTLTASYTYGGVIKTATKVVTIIDVTETLTGLTIYGPDSVNEGSSAEYREIADWSDGTSTVVTPTWSENSSYASINSSGTLSSLAVQSDQLVVITATYTFGGITKTITKQVAIINIDTTPDQFTLTSRINAPLNAAITSNIITVSGINKTAPVSITGGSYSINGGAYTTATGVVNSGDTVKVFITSSASYFTSTSAILTIGDVSSTFQVRTVGLSTYTVTSSADANGSITPNTAQTVNLGNSATFTITPTSGYSVVTPIGSTCPQSTYNPSLTTNNYSTGEITANCTVSATFIKSGVSGWQQQADGLFGGSINTLAIAPSNSQTVYLGTTNGGVFKSDNSGTSWNSINTGLAYSYIYSLAIDPYNNQTIYAGTSGGGVYKSSNGGTSWNSVNTGLTTTSIHALAIASNNGQTVYAGTTSGGVFKSTNGGGSWSAVNTGLTETYIYTLVIDPNNSQTIYAGTSAGGVFRSDNGGTSWSVVNSGLTSTNIRALTINANNSQTIYAGTSDGGVFKSTNGGKSWAAANTGLTYNSIYSLVIDPNNNQIIYAGTSGGGVYKSSNDGGNWGVASSGLTNNYANALAIDPNNNQIMYAGTSGGGVFKSNNSGGAWSVNNTGVTNAYVYSLSVDPNNKQAMYAGTGGGVFKSGNDGVSWSTVNTGLTNINVRSVAIDPNNSQTVYAGTYGSGVYKSNNGGGNWSAINTGLTYNYIYSLTIDPSNSQTIYAGATSGGLYKSENGGGSWSAAKTGLPNVTVYSLDIDRNNNQTIYAGTSGGAYRSDNGGESWSAVNSGLMNTYVYSMAIDPSNSLTIYAGTSGGVFKSSNGGGGWNLVTTGLTTGTVYSLAIAPNNSQTIYAGTSAGSVFRSTNGGVSWIAINTGLIKTIVSAIIIDPANSRTIQVGTRGGGVYKTIDGGTVPLSYTVTPTVGVNGNITPNIAQTVSGGTTATFTITPNNGYTVVTPIGGTCPQGTLNGTTYTTGTITTNCTVAPAFTASPVTGACGSSSGGTFTIAPSTNLCASGTASTVTGTGPWNWSCAGLYGGGSSPTCSANIQTYAITFQIGGNGTLTGTASQTVTFGASTTQVTAVPATGYHFVNWTGTNGFITTTANPLTVSNVTAAQAITANFAASVTGNPTIALGTASCSKEGTATIPITLTNTPGINIAAVGVDIAYDAVNLTNPAFAKGAACIDAGKTFISNTLAPGRLRIGVTGLSNPIGNGVLATVTFTCDPSAPSGAYALINTPQAATPTGQPVNVTGVNGTITVSAIPGTCGTSNSGTFTTVPSTNLCATGAASTVTGAGPWNWSCAGLYGGGSSPTCSANIQTYAITFQIGGNGTLTGRANQTVNFGTATTQVTAVPATDYHFVNWTGTNGFVTAITNPLMVSNVTATQTITANFAPDSINGACGASNGQTFATKPTTNLCGDNGLPTVSGTGPWNWKCTGSNGGTEATCSALITTVNAGTVQLPQTGQTTCYDATGATISCTGTGQDGELKMGVAWPTPRFTDNGDQTITDKLTGLIWTQSANSAEVKKSLQDALNYIKDLNSSNYLGHNDWRLPNVNELNSLVNREQPIPSTWLNKQGFTDVQADWYGSSTTYTSDIRYFLAFDMTGGSMGSAHRVKSVFYIWPLRSGQPGSLTVPKTGQTTCYDATGATITCTGTGQDGELQMGVAWPNPRFSTNNQTVTDNLTGLVWSKDGNPAASTKTWQEALDYIKILNSQNYLGYSDWRLPNQRELESLVNWGLTYTIPWLNAQGFDNVQKSYVSSTSSALSSDYVWFARIDVGGMNYSSKTFDYNVLPVRAGQSGNTSKPGDSDGDGSVSIAEVQSAINMFLGVKALELCVDQNGVEGVTISEVQKVINGFLGM